MPTTPTISHEQTHLPPERERFGVEEERINSTAENSDAFSQNETISDTIMSVPATDFSMAGNTTVEMSTAVTPFTEAVQPAVPVTVQDFSREEEEPIGNIEEILEFSPVAASDDDGLEMNGNGEILPPTPEKIPADKAPEPSKEPKKVKNEKPEKVLRKPKRRPITAPFPRDTTEDPAFTATSDQVTAVADTEAATNPAAQDAASAQLAAPMAENEEMGNAQRQQVTDMEQQETGTFDAEAFKEKLLQRIENMSLPANLKQADNFDDNNNIDSVRRSAMGEVAEQEENAAGPLRETTAEAPDPESVPQREVAELPEQPVGELPEPVPAAEGMPDPRPESHVRFPLEDYMTQVRYEFDSNEISDEQLRISNEPTFIHALQSKDQLEENVETAPGQFRAAEE
ncbi:MAG: hypothetical protein WBA74_09865, partial [Cyclobacteriaceae bacterium]